MVAPTPGLPQPRITAPTPKQREAAESATAYNDEQDAEGAGGSSSSSAAAAPAGTKRPADIVTEDLADIMALHVGSAFLKTAQGSISEIYSPPRVVPHAEKAGFGAGWSLDLTVNDEDGEPWDFSRHECREKARQLIHKTRPLLLVGSPMCTWFSVLQNLNKKKMGTMKWEE